SSDCKNLFRFFFINRGHRVKGGKDKTNNN
ncbi:MAG: hypothetical protein ACJAU1_000588, partial [Psychromonas sp.]